jgi:hypothetical protein
MQPETSSTRSDAMRHVVLAEAIAATLSVLIAPCSRFRSPEPHSRSMKPRRCGPSAEGRGNELERTALADSSRLA